MSETVRFQDIEFIRDIKLSYESNEDVPSSIPDAPKLGEFSFTVEFSDDDAWSIFSLFAPEPGQKVLEIEMQLGRVKLRECPPIGEVASIAVGVSGDESFDIGPLRLDRYQPSDGDGPAWVQYGRYTE